MSEKKKHFLSWYFDFNLLYRILIGLIIGAALGVFLQAQFKGDELNKILTWVQPFGDLFVRLLKMIMMPIILSTMIVGSSSVSPANLGKVGIRIIILYLVTSAIAVAIGLCLGGVFQPRAELTNVAEAAAKASNAPTVVQTLLAIVPTSFADALVKETILAVIFFSLVFGISLSYLRVSKDERVKHAADTLFHVFEAIAEVMMFIVRGIMEYAPIGVLSLVATVFAKNGPQVIGALGVVTAAAFIGYALHIIIVYLGMIKLSGLKVGRYLREARLPFFTGLVTRSSNGTLPTTIQAAHNLGVPKEVYSFSLPLGATINMDGTAIYQGVCVTFIALSVGTQLTLDQMGIIVLTATLASVGTAGVPGAGAIMLLMVLESIGLPVTAGSAVAGAYAMILGIDAILDMGRTALNVTGDLTCTTVVAKGLKMIDTSKW